MLTLSTTVFFETNPLHRVVFDIVSHAGTEQFGSELLQRETSQSV
jgi:hypothetical protein